MAKCSICKSRKGKRKCIGKNIYICSFCCGNYRQKEICGNCQHFKEVKLKRKYNEVPMYSLQMMDDCQDLQDYADAIESSLCAFDYSLGNQIKDDTVLKILELLLDTFHFKENIIISNDEIVDNGFAFVNKTVKEDLCEISEEVITKIIRTIYFVAKRRTRGQREYLDFIHQYVGIRVAKGMRILSL